MATANARKYQQIAPTFPGSYYCDPEILEKEWEKKEKAEAAAKAKRIEERRKKPKVVKAKPAAKTKAKATTKKSVTK